VALLTESKALCGVNCQAQSMSAVAPLLASSASRFARDG
jgi:hypothetical protein